MFLRTTLLIILYLILILGLDLCQNRQPFPIYQTKAYDAKTLMDQGEQILEIYQ